MKRSVAIALVAIIGVAGGLYVLRDTSVQDDMSGTNEIITGSNEGSAGSSVPARLQGTRLNVNFDKASIPLDQVLSGGPGKDGIPALTDPSFTSIADAEGIQDDVQVMYVAHNGEEKLYPYNVLVWHEIVNDTVGGKSLAITFCPLCGSAIVFEREIDGQIVDFGVSGLLYQSNLLMYSREDSESLWSQSRGEAVVGSRTDTKLEHFPTQVMTFAEARDKFSDAQVMSTDTGERRDYQATPYAGYEDTEDTYFPVEVEDKRFPAKEVFYVVPLEGSSLAVRQTKDDGTYKVPDTDIEVTVDNGQISARWGDAELPGYFEMWFSWATHHSETGIVLD